MNPDPPSYNLPNPYPLCPPSTRNRLTLWASIGMSLFSAVLGLVSGQFALVAFGLLFAGINFCYM